MQMKHYAAALATTLLITGAVNLWPASAQPTAAAAPAAAAADDEKAGATFEVYKDKSGQFRWRLRSQNTQVIATSGAGYVDKRDCIAGIESVKKHAVKAPIKEVTEAPAAE